MSKVVSIILAILLAIVAIFMTIGLVFLIKNDFKFSGKINISEPKLIEEKEFEYINNLNVDTRTTDVYIKKSDDNKIKVQIYSDRVKEKEITNTEESLIVKLREENCSFCFFNFKSSKIYVYLPENYNKNIIINSTTGDIHIDEFKLATSNISLTTGDIHIDAINNVNIKGTTGDVNVGDVNDIVTQIRTGDIRIDNVYNYLSLTTTTGDIRIEKANLNRNSSISSTTGDIKIRTINNIYVDVNSNVGDVKVNNNNRKSDIELTIKSNVGDVKVNY